LSIQIKGNRNNFGIYEISLESKDSVKKFKFPSVTTILGLMKNPELEQLKKEIGDPKEFKRISSTAANRGNVMHLFLENFCLGLQQGFSKNNSLLFSQQKTNKIIEQIYEKSEIEKGIDLFYNLYHSPFIDEMKKPLLIEGLMVSFLNKYAGRTDIIYQDNRNKIILGDYKSSSNIILPGSIKEIKYKLQLSAYINAFEETRNLKIFEGVIWVGHPTGYQKIVLSKYEYEIFLQYFLQLRKEFKK